MQRYLQSLTFAAPLCLVCFAGPVLGQTSTSTTFGVSITIENSCTIVSASDMDFGPVGTLTSQVTSSSTIVLNCTTGAPYTITLDAGTGSGGTTSTREMTNGSETVSYQLYSDNGLTQPWGLTASDDVSSTGTGLDQSFPVFGAVPIQPTPSANTYTDTIGVVVNF